MPLLYVLLMFATPIAAGIVFGFVQLGVYRLARRPSADTPAFPVLFARGLLAFFLIAAVLALATRAAA